MQVLIEPKNDLEKVEDAFGAKEELVGILEAAQDTNNTLSPIEVATLQMTMKQIDKGMELPATESYITFPEFFTTLAIENLKENIGNKWKEFVKAIKSIYKRVIDFLSLMASKLKQRFSKKNKSTDQVEDETETQDRKEALLNKEYTLPKYLIDMGSEASADTIIERLEYLPKLLSFVDVATGQHGGVAKSLITAPEMFVKTDQWTEFTNSRTQAVLDFFVDDLGAVVNNQRAVASISDTVNIVMPLIDVASFPSLKINEDETAVIKLPENLTAYADKLDKSSFELFRKLERFIKETKKIFNDEPNIEKISDPEARKKIMQLMPIYNKRLTLVNKTLKLANATMDIADDIVNDIRGSGTLGKESFYNEIDFLMLGTEDLKENISGKWKAVVAAIKKVYERVRDFLKVQFQKLKNNFKRKAGEKNSKFERETEGGEQSTDDSQDKTKTEEPAKTSSADMPEVEVMPKVKSYEMAFAYFEWNGSANAETFVQRIKHLTTLAAMADKISKVHDTRVITEAAVNLDDEEWTKFLQSKGQEVLDIIVEDFGGQVRGYEVKLSITENVNIFMRLQNILSYPELVIDLKSKGKLEFPDDTEAYTSTLNQTLRTTLKSLDDFFIFGVPDFTRLTDPRAQQRIADAMPIYNKRAKLTADIGRLISDCIDIAQNILADFRKNG